jgi:hypothetical protein
MRPSGRRLGDPRQQLEDRALPGSVVADQPDDLAVANRHRQVAEGPEGLALQRWRAPPDGPLQTPLRGLDDALPEGVVAPLVDAKGVALSQRVGLDRDVAHQIQTTSAKLRSTRSK